MFARNRTQEARQYLTMDEETGKAVDALQVLMGEKENDSGIRFEPFRGMKKPADIAKALKRATTKQRPLLLYNLAVLHARKRRHAKAQRILAKIANNSSLPRTSFYPSDAERELTTSVSQALAHSPLEASRVVEGFLSQNPRSPQALLLKRQLAPFL